MIKKILFISIIMCEVICFSGCGEGTAEQTTAATSEQTDNSDTRDEVTTDEQTSQKGTEPTSKPITEPTSEQDTDNPNVSMEDVYEQFEGYTVKKIYITMKAESKVNVRKGPSEDYEKVSVIDEEQVVNVIGQCNETGWYMISVDGVKCFVSNAYLVASEENNNLVLGDECPYPMYVKTEYEEQLGWFYRVELGWQPLKYKEILKAIEDEGYTEEEFPIYVGTWRDMGDVMWIGYSKK